MPKVSEPEVHEMVKYYEANTKPTKTEVSNLFYAKKFVGEPRVYTVVKIEIEESTKEVYEGIRALDKIL